MATQSHAQAVKSLNKGAGRRRFVFKKFSQRIEEIEVDVFRSLDPLKPEPSQGSSFFLDCLVEWRELNTAEDFISFYEEMLPLVQTLPLIILQKNFILSKLLSRLDMKGRLSLEPILRLIAALSRDLLEDFIPFLQPVADSMVSLLENGAEREPEIIEQIFTSWSCIMMYLQRYLTRNIVHILEVTARLRFYPKDYIQEFMVESVSFLLRNAPFDQLKEGIRKIVSEVVEKPLETRKSGVSTLLFHVMKGFSSKLHSRAEQVLQQLLDNDVICRGDQNPEGPNPVVEVVIMTVQRLCEELQPAALNLMWKFFYDEISKCIASGCSVRLTHLLSLFISTVEIDNVMKVLDSKAVLELVLQLVQTFIMPSLTGKTEDQSNEIIDKTLQLMLCILDYLHGGNHLASLSSDVSVQWAPVFELRNTSFLNFVKELLVKDASILRIFRTNIISALADLLPTSEEEVIYLFHEFCEKLQPLSYCSFDDISKDWLSRIGSFLEKAINDEVHVDPSCKQFQSTNLAQLWGVISCYSYVIEFQANPSVITDLLEALDRFLKVDSESIAGFPRQTWESVIGAALVSYHKLVSARVAEHDKLSESRFLYFAKKYKSSFHVLSSVADFLDSVSRIQADGTHKTYRPELEAVKAADAFNIFSENLCHSDKRVRLSTLRILCHYERLNAERSNMITDDSYCDEQSSNVLQLLLDIESISHNIDTSRKVELWINKIQMDLSAGRISEAHLPLVVDAIIGILHNRFNRLWNPAIECLAVLIGKYPGIAWERFVKYLEKCVSNCLSYFEQSERGNSELFESCDSLVRRFHKYISPSYGSTPLPTVLSLLIKSSQKVSNVVESRSRQIIPLFLKFLGYEVEDLSSVKSYISQASKGKDWKDVLEEWLNLVKLMHNPKSFYRNQFLKEVLQYRLLDENDPEVQSKVLDCLLNWKDEFLLPYAQHLKNLINTKNLRDELTRWSLSRESNLINEQHRACLVPLVIRILIPKVRKLKSLASRKVASVHHRKAVIAFIAGLDVDELPLFFALLIKPLQTVSPSGDAVDNLLWVSPRTPDGFDSFVALRHFTLDNIKAHPSKKIYGFLHVVEEILGVFDESRINPFLDMLMGCVVRIMASCTPSMDSIKNSESFLEGSSSNLSVNAKDDGAEKEVMTSPGTKQYKDLRSLCLKIIALVLSKFENHDFDSEFWDMFFSSLKPLIDSFKQEGASSEKPSSLFLCFLAMSRSYKLVSLFHRVENLVPDIFSILTITTASEAIVSSVLKFIENLLSLDSELDSCDSDVKKILLPNVNTLVCSLHNFFTCKNATNRKSVRYLGGRELNIFRLLPKYIEDPSIGRKFVDILLPSLTKKPHDSDACLKALHVIQDMAPMLGSEGTVKILNTISPLLISATLEVRLGICDMLDALAGGDPSLLHVAKLLREFNATSAFEMGGLDYDTIISAYEKIDNEFYGSAREDHALVILSQCVHDMSSKDLILRNSAYRVLLLFLEFSQKILKEEKEEEESTDGRWSVACIQDVINNFFLKHMGDAMNKEASVQKVWMDLLREMVLRLPEVSELKSYTVLCSEDAEQDFFNNVIHLQKHRRARALTRFCNIIGSCRLSEVITNKVLVPLSFNMLLEVNDGKGEHLRNACIQALSSISGCMGWKPYYALLNRCFRELKLKPDKQKLFLRLICSILDHYHFSGTNSGEESKGSSEKVSNPEMTLTKCTAVTTQSNDIQTCLHKNILPKIQKLLTLDIDNVNVNVSLVAMKLLKLLPGNILETQLPSIIQRVSNFLKSRLESVRDEARSALAACLKELGLEYLQFVLKVLQGTLRRGFELHVLGFTLNFILSKCLPGAACGQLDYCLEELLSVAVNDIVGDVSEEKEVDKIAAKMKETRKKKSFETLKLIAENITFKSHVLKLLSPVTDLPQKQQLTPKLKAKLETMLHHTASGIECNPSANDKHLFIFANRLIEKNIVEQNQGSEMVHAMKSSKQKKDDASGETSISGRLTCASPQCSHLIGVFAIGLLHSRMKKMKLNKNDEQLLSLLDPFIGLLSRCLNSKYQDITSAAIRCLSRLVRLPLPSLESQSDNIKGALFVILQGSASLSSPLTDPSIRLLTVLLRSTSITLSSDQIRMLVQFLLCVDLERNPSDVALSLLKAIVKRKVEVSEIYDLAGRVAELMVTSQLESIRKKCSQIFLQFLLDYPLSKERLQQHLDILLAYLWEYEHSTGREAVLEMVHAIIIKFPRQVVDDRSHTLFLLLVRSLANDSDNKVRSMSGAAIKLLVGRVSSGSISAILEDCLIRYSGENQASRSVGAQALGLLVEVMKKGFQKQIDNIFPVMRRILQSAVANIKNSQADPCNEPTPSLWKEAYYSLVMLEKVLLQFSELWSAQELEDIWETIIEFLLHPHIWLRNISSRLVALHFAKITEACQENAGKSIRDFFLMRPSRLFLVAVSLCSQLKVSLTDDAANYHLRQNIVFAICGLYSTLGVDKDTQFFWSALEQNDEGRLLRAFVILDSSKGRSMFASLASGLNGQRDIESCERFRYLLISSLLKRMGKIALDMEGVQMRIVFDTFRLISPMILSKSEVSEQLGDDNGQSYAYQVLLPLYKICEGFAGKVIPDDVKQLAQEVRDSIRDTIGVQNFVQVYNLIQKNLKAKRDKRRQGEKLMAVVNPERNAKRKLRNAAKHREHKKRKIMTMKFGRMMR